MQLLNTDVLIKEPADVYHAQAGEYLSSHQLSDFRKSPLLYHRKVEGLIEDQDRPAYRVGRAAHTLILEGRDRLEAEYAVGGPINGKTGKPYGRRSKTWQRWAASLEKDVITESDMALIEQLNAAVGANTLASELLADGVAEGVVRTSYCGVACQARIDWLNPAAGLVDLKTCDDLDYLEHDARRYGYAYQLALYEVLLRRALAQALGEADGFSTGARQRTIPVFLVAVEKKEPYRCGVWRIGEGVLAQARQENEAAIDRLKECRRTHTWPTGYEDLRTFDYL